MAELPHSLAISFLVPLLAGCATAPKSEQVSFRQLLETPAKFNGQKVTLTACAFNSLHGSVLLECGATGKPIGLGIQSKTHPAYPAYDKFFGVQAQFSMPRVKARLVGTYEWRSGEIPSRVLWVEQILEAQRYEP